MGGRRAEQAEARLVTIVADLEVPVRTLEIRDAPVAKAILKAAVADQRASRKLVGLGGRCDDGQAVKSVRSTRNSMESLTGKQRRGAHILRHVAWRCIACSHLPKGIAPPRGQGAVRAQSQTV